MKRAFMSSMIVPLTEAIKIVGRVQRTKKAQRMFHDVEVDVEELPQLGAKEPILKPLALISFYKVKSDE